VPLSLITRILVAGLALRLAADLIDLVLWLQPYFEPWGSLRGLSAPSISDLFRYSYFSKLTVWALHEFPQTVVYVVDIIFVEGLYRVWRNLRRVRQSLQESAPA
jgi:hypothetical protein